MQVMVVTEDGLCMCDCKKISESAISKKSDWAIKGRREKMFLSKAATSGGADTDREDKMVRKVGRSMIS